MDRLQRLTVDTTSPFESGSVEIEALLRQLDDESTSRVAQQLARQLRALAPGLTASRSRRVARLVVVVASEGLDDVCRSGSIDALSLRDLTDLLVTYLESVLEGR